MRYWQLLPHTENNCRRWELSLWIGSVARDEARPDSDVDFLVEFVRSGGFFQLLQVQYYLEDILNSAVDLATENALREHLREPGLKDIIHAS